MEFRPLTEVSLPAGSQREYDRWLAGIGERLEEPGTDRNALVRRTLTGLYHPAHVDADPADPTLPDVLRRALLPMDPRNVTLEAEYYPEIDRDRYERIKPLCWLWQLFDRSPAGANLALGVRLRRLLARHIFGSVGRNFKAFGGVSFSLGYNLHVGDDVVVHRGVVLDDRGGIRIGDAVTLEDQAVVRSQRPSLRDGRLVETPVTSLERGVRIGSRATVLAGVRLGEGAVLGSMGVATRDIAAGDVALGIPATATLKRPAAGSADLPRTRDPLADPAPPPAPIGRPASEDGREG